MNNKRISISTWGNFALNLRILTLTPFFRKLSFTSHITFSIGWFGAVVGFLSLAISGVTNHNPQVVRAAYIAMELISWYVIVPACLASLVTGVIQGLLTPWGLFRHYWIIAKLLLTVIATVLLLLHMQPITYLGSVVLQHHLTENELHRLRIQLIADAGAALLILLTAILFSVYKPWGRTSFSTLAKPFDNINRGNVGSSQIKYWVKGIALTLIILTIIMFILLHLTGDGLIAH